MTAAAAGAGMPGMQGAFIDDLNGLRLEGGAQLLLDRCGACSHGRTLRNGRTVTSE